MQQGYVQQDDLFFSQLTVRCIQALSLQLGSCCTQSIITI